MARKEHIELAIRSITSEKAKAIEIAKQHAIQEKISPHNADVDKQCNEAVNELTATYQKDIADRKQKYEEERQRLVEMANHNKQVFQTTTLNTISTEVGAEYDLTLSELEKVLEKIGE